MKGKRGKLLKTSFSSSQATFFSNSTSPTFILHRRNHHPPPPTTKTKQKIVNQNQDQNQTKHIYFIIACKKTSRGRVLFPVAGKNYGFRKVPFPIAWDKTVLGKYCCRLFVKAMVLRDLASCLSSLAASEMIKDNRIIDIYCHGCRD